MNSDNAYVCASWGMPVGVKFGRVMAVPSTGASFAPTARTMKSTSGEFELPSLALTLKVSELVPDFSLLMAAGLATTL